ncbi:catalase isozyme 2-like isoform X19 [Solanum pennellii]|uniref:Catalase isozyme 2-like isoform X19 n=1 Tax=Solanum pennellii TaxID=28526 RepID=A0ABM1V3F0_SOLPN|nr:catalase isozyme 2-like isoform X19 [Solanum pennellii]
MRMSSYISALVLWFQGFITQMIKCFKLIVSPTLIARGIDLDQTICNFLLMLQSVLNNHYDGSMNFMHRDEYIDYFPSRYDQVCHAEMYPIPFNSLPLQTREVIIQNENNFNQAGEMYCKFTFDR